MKKQLITIFAALVFVAMPAKASLINIDLGSTTGSLANGYTISVPSVGNLLLQYSANGASTIGQFEDGSGLFAGGANFVLRKNDELNISSLDFTIESIVFEIWDLDTVTSVAEKVWFNGGNSLVGVSNNIQNSTAFSQGIFSSAITTDAMGNITVSADILDGGFAVAGMQITVADSVNAVSEPAYIAFLGLLLLGLRVVARRR